MSQSLTKYRGKSGVQALLDQTSSLRRRNQDLRHEVKTSLTPAAATMWVQLGAVAAGAMRAYAPDKAASLQGFGALAAIAAGSAYGSPEAVALGNGLGASVITERTHAMLAKQRNNNVASMGSNPVVDAFEEAA